MNLRRCRREHNGRLLECALPGRPFARPCATGVRAREGATPGSYSDVPGRVGFSRGTEPAPADIQVADARRRVRGRTTESSVWPDPLRAPRSSWLPILHRRAGNRTAGRSEAQELFRHTRSIASAYFMGIHSNKWG